MLEGLVKEGLPSRGEMTDAAMAARAECVLLNKGPNVVAAVDGQEFHKRDKQKLAIVTEAGFGADLLPPDPERLRSIVEAAMASLASWRSFRYAGAFRFGALKSLPVSLFRWPSHARQVGRSASMSRQKSRNASRAAHDSARRRNGSRRPASACNTARWSPTDGEVSSASNSSYQAMACARSPGASSPIAR